MKDFGKSARLVSRHSRSLQAGIHSACGGCPPKDCGHDGLEPRDLYRQRFADVDQRKRAAMWRVLCRVTLQRYIERGDVVVDLGAGYCEFINAIECGRKIAVDANAAMREYAAGDVEVILGDIPEALDQVGDASADIVFCSNFFEHLRDKDMVLAVLRGVHRMLRTGGRLIVIQPNIRYAYKEYWDFFDHQVALSHSSFCEALQLAAFQIEELRPRFLPYTTKSRLPQAAWLMRLYLALRPAQWLFGKQMLVVARKVSA
jgi:SAM-dependent methyltransferase